MRLQKSVHNGMRLKFWGEDAPECSSCACKSQPSVRYHLECICKSASNCECGRNLQMTYETHLPLRYELFLKSVLHESICKFKCHPIMLVLTRICAYCLKSDSTKEPRQKSGLHLRNFRSFSAFTWSTLDALGVPSL